MFIALIAAIIISATFMHGPAAVAAFVGFTAVITIVNRHIRLKRQRRRKERHRPH